METTCEARRSTPPSEDEWLAVLSGSKSPSALRDYTGPVEVFHDSSQRKGRGLRTTRAVRAGEILLIAQPLAYCEGFDKKQANQKIVESLLIEEDDDIISALQDLSDGSVLDDSNTSELSRKNINGIVNVNGFQLTESRFALYHLPSYLNHSCISNCTHVFVGNVLVSRAGRDLACGEELTFAYFIPIDLNFKARQERTQNGWNFVCSCEFCRLEMDMGEPLESMYAQCHRKLELLCKLFEQLVSGGAASRMSAASLSQQFRAVLNVVENFVQETRLNERQANMIRAMFIGGMSTYRALSEYCGNTDDAVQLQCSINEVQQVVEPGSLEQCKTSWIAKTFAETYCLPSTRVEESADICSRVHRVRYGGYDNERIMQLGMIKTGELLIRGKGNEWTLDFK